MFWQAHDPERNPQPRWLQRFRRAVDLAVAFATLEDREDLGRAPSSPPGHPDAPQAHDHPHRRPLQQGRHRRRAGAVPARVAPCTTPLAPPAARRRTRARGGLHHAGR